MSLSLVLLCQSDFCLRVQGGGGWVGGAVGGTPRPPRRPWVVRGAEGAEEIFWPKLTCAEGARENF